MTKYNKLMIKIGFILIIFSIISILFLSNLTKHYKHIDTTLSSIILSQSRNDSLFMVHYSKCSFISNTRIKIDSRGYLMLKQPYDK